MKLYTAIWNTYVKEIEAVDKTEARTKASALFSKYKRFKPTDQLLVLEQ